MLNNSRYENKIGHLPQPSLVCTHSIAIAPTARITTPRRVSVFDLNPFALGGLTSCAAFFKPHPTLRFPRRCPLFRSVKHEYRIPCIPDVFQPTRIAGCAQFKCVQRLPYSKTNVVLER